jgi:hypothetical protein
MIVARGRGLFQRFALIAALAAVPTLAHAQGLAAWIETGFAMNDATTTDAAGRSLVTTSWEAPQNYRLIYDSRVFPLLSLSATGTFRWIPSETSAEGGGTVSSSQTLWNLYAAATVGPSNLSVTPYFSLVKYGTTSSLAAATSGLGSTSFGAAANWLPAELPKLALRLSRTHNYDSGGATQDTLSDEALLALRYDDLRVLTIRAAMRYSHNEDQLNASWNGETGVSAQLAYSDTFLDRRLTVGATYLPSYRVFSVGGSGGTVRVQQFPVEGLSLVEAPPALPSRNTLLQNPALIDGDVLTSAGIDIGYQPTQSGDTRNRDLGLRFVDATVPVNLLYVWVDRLLPPMISGTFAWSAWWSDDNVTWVEIPLAGPVMFNQLANRFEIPIPQTQARYLKVVTRPLAGAVTVDPQYADIFVTELQAWLETPVSEASRRTDQFTSNATGNLRFVILRGPDLTYDFSGFLVQGQGRLVQTWQATNGVSFDYRLTRALRTAARIERSDGAQAGGVHEFANRWSLQVTVDPFPALNASLTYSGAVGFLSGQNIREHSMTLSVRTDLYTGVSLYALGGIGTRFGEAFGDSRSASATAGATLIPFQALNLQASCTYATQQGNSGLPGRVNGDLTTIQVNANFNPTPSLYLTGGLIRTLGSQQVPSNQFNVNAAFSPFPDGDLLLRFSYIDNLDTAQSTRARILGPSLRWNIRGGTHLDVSYNWIDSLQPALTTKARTFFVDLTIAL